jgi:hypothetical protein
MHQQLLKLILLLTLWAIAPIAPPISASFFDPRAINGSGSADNSKV